MVIYDKNDKNVSYYYKREDNKKMNENVYIKIIAEQQTEIDKLKELKKELKKTKLDKYKAIRNNINLVDGLNIDLIVDEIAKEVYFDYDNNDKKVIKDVLIKHINLSK